MSDDSARPRLPTASHAPSSIGASPIDGLPLDPPLAGEGSIGAGETEIPAASPINIRNLSVKCGRCGQYQVLAAFRPLDEEWNQYVYECEWPPCDDDPAASRTLLEVPADLDEFARRDPGWRGGRIHGGAEARAEASDGEG